MLKKASRMFSSRTAYVNRTVERTTNTMDIQPETGRVAAFRGRKKLIKRVQTEEPESSSLSSYIVSIYCPAFLINTAKRDELRTKSARKAENSLQRKAEWISQSAASSLYGERKGIENDKGGGLLMIDQE